MTMALFLGIKVLFLDLDVMSLLFSDERGILVHQENEETR
jgi:hypothetical protein